MNPTDCFSEIKTKSNELALYLEDLISSQNLSWDKHFGFDVIFLDSSWIQKELALKEINELHQIRQIGLLKVSSKYCYHWHVDDFRQSCINSLISKDHYSHTLFGEYKDVFYYNNLIELKYKPYTSYEILRDKLKSILINT